MIIVFPQFEYDYIMVLFFNCPKMKKKKYGSVSFTVNLTKLPLVDLFSCSVSIISNDFDICHPLI